MRRRVKNQHRPLLKKNGQKVAFIQLVPKIKVLKLRIGADWCRVRTLHADVNQMVLLGVSLPPLLLYQRQLLQIILKSEIYAYSDHFVYIRGKWLNRGYMYIVKISSLVLYMCIYISKKYLVHIAEFETGVLWQNRCIAIDTARNPSKKTYEQLFEAKSRKVNCKGMENTDWIFPSLSYSLFYCFKSNKKSL